MLGLETLIKSSVNNMDFSLYKTAAIIVVSAVLFFAGTGFGAYVAHKYYAPRLVAANAKINLLTIANIQFKHSAETQNAQIEELKKITVQREKDAQAAIEESKSKAKVYQNTAQKIERIHPPANVVCLGDAAAASFDAELAEEKKK